QPALLVIGGEADSANLAVLRDVWRDKPVLFAENLPLVYLPALFERAALFIGHDSGISHLAAAAGARCVLLFGPTDPDVWAPANPNVRVLTAQDGDLEKLEIDAVITSVNEAL